MIVRKSRFTDAQSGSSRALRITKARRSRANFPYCKLARTPKYRIKQRLLHHSGVYIHFLIVFAIRFDIDHDGRERARYGCRGQDDLIPSLSDADSAGIPEAANM